MASRYAVVAGVIHEGPAAENLLPLTGFSVGITAMRRAEELGALLVRKGATVRYGPAIRIVSVADDTDLFAATKRLLEERVDAVVVTTGIGFRGWVEAAEGWGLSDALLDRLALTSMLTRGPKAKGAVRAAGLTEAYSPQSESNAEVLQHLLSSGVAGRRIAVQLHGEPLPHFVDSLRNAGAEVIQIPVYRWMGPADPAPLDRLLDATVAGCVDALLFTSAPAVASVLAVASRSNRLPKLIELLTEQVVAGCVGPITARPLAAHGVPTVQPSRARIGALARAVAQALADRVTCIRAAGRKIELRGQVVLVDGELRDVAPAPMAVLRALARSPGRVVSRRELTSALPGGGQEHAVEAAITRLRSSLGEGRLVQTVVKRGYRLALDREPA